MYKATPHRVKNSSDTDRLSAPFFFDPNFKCLVSPLAVESSSATANQTPILYGQYILNKVLNNFPELQQSALTEINPNNGY